MAVNKAVAKRPKRLPGEPVMTVVLRDIPPGYNWGWFSREDPRMHLQPVDDEHRHLDFKLWLESQGRRIIESAGTIPARILKKLESAVPSYRLTIEARWASFMIKSGWLRLVHHLPKVTLVAYPGTRSEFRRTTDLHEDLVEPYLSQLKPVDVVLSKDLAAIELWPKRHESDRIHISIPEILWLD